jgi:hypothetical protein
MPSGGTTAYPGEMLKLLRSPAALRRLGSVFVPVLPSCDAGQVADVVVGRVAVDVVNVHARRDWPVMVHPNIAMKPVTSPRKVSAVRRVIALRVSVVLVTIEYNRLDNNACRFERHDVSP